MARSLAKIHQQIAKLQQEADSIQSSVIARIRKEIAQHGLTADHLFGNSARASGSSTKSLGRKASTSKSSEAKPAKYADGQGNTWHGIGKRPNWIHAALDAGGSLEDFLVNGNHVGKASKNATTKPAAAAKKPSKKIVVRKPASKKPAAKETANKSEVAKKAPAKTAARTKPTTKAAAKKASASKPAVKRASASKPKAAPVPEAVVASN